MNCKPQLSELQPGQTAVIRNLSAEGAMRRRLQDMGMIEGTQVECIGRSPLGDPAAYLVRGAVVALRKSDAGSIAIERAEAAPAVCPFRSHATVPLGTAGR
ncbi:ferrous iron transport protein A [uncultured Neglectibacter sp.]|uniref:FeoA family protein n=1 Tax=uncultured Neglectibacter sp. TaxID=1924108 RepID=UPI0034DE1E96